MTTNDNHLVNHEEEIDLSELFALLWLKKWFIILFVILCSLLAYKYLSNLPDRYTSSILIMFKESKSTNDTLQTIMTGGLSAADDTDTELELLKSRRFAGQIVDSLGLISHAEYKVSGLVQSGFQIDESRKRSYAIDILMANMNISKTSGTNLVKVSYESLSSEHAAVVANEIANTFINFKQELMEGKNQDRATWLESKLAGVRDSLENSEQRIVEHQNKNDFIDIHSSIALEKSKIAQLAKEKLNLNREIEELNLFKQQFKKYKEQPDELTSLPGFVDSKTILSSQSIFDNRKEAFSQIKLRYGYKHPAYKKSESAYLDARDKLNKEFESQSKVMDKQQSLWESKLAVIEKEMRLASDRLKELGEIEFDYQKLRREFEANLQLYENLVKKLKESDMMQDLANASNVLLVERAEVANRPNNKKEPLIMALTVLLSSFVAAAIVLVQGLLANKVIQFRKVARDFDTKLVGIIPKVKIRKNKNKPLYGLDSTKHIAFYEALRTTRTNILLDSELSKQKVIAVTSISPNDGKSTLSIQLAASFSELEKVILIDADLRFPSIGETLKQDINHPGLTNLIAKRSKLAECLCKEQRYEFDVLPAGFRAKNPLLYLSQPRLKKIIEFFKGRYERVVIECPPIMSVSDAYIISKHVDSIYLVVDAEKTSKADLVNVLEELQQAKVNVGGILMNKAKNAEQYYNNSYYKHMKTDLSGIKFAY